MRRPAALPRPTTAHPPGRHPVRRRRWGSALATCVVAGGLLAAPAPAAAVETLPTGFRLRTVTTTLDRATAMAVLPNGSVLVAEQGGTLRMVRDGRLLPTPVLRLTVDSAGERGLIGVAVDPGYARTGHIYVHHTVPGTPARNRVSRFTLPPGGTTAGGGRTLLTLPGLTTRHHNGGALHIDAAGKLLVAVGDNGDPARARNLASPFGKVLRIERATGAAAAGNPFLGSSNTWTRRLWTSGLRNPFTMAVHPTNGRVHINDVGQDSYEEINLGRAGADYGWPASEGPVGVTRGITGPVEHYGHDDGCSIAGGTFHPGGGGFPTDYRGDYLYADFCAGWIRRYDVGTDRSTRFATGFAQVVDLRSGPRGVLWVLERGALKRVVGPVQPW